jgi:DNA-binding transcriptional LysR family regulator
MERQRRLQQLRQLSYNDLAADRQVVAAVAAMEAILAAAAAGEGWGTVTVSENCEKLLLHLPGLAPRSVV